VPQGDHDCLLDPPIGRVDVLRDTQDEDPRWLNYQRLLRASTAEWRTTEPFRVKVEYQLDDLAGSRVGDQLARTSLIRAGGIFAWRGVGR
jgi:hypothetical protein